MPLNTLRLNHLPSSHPNDRIVFIKPLTSRPQSSASTIASDSSRAELMLKAIAAQCLPIMKAHHLSITTLEEHEWNQEFIGRNFNNGEIIQLVLQHRDGRWMSLSSVQMVMMHELAHNTHMNHGRDFWKTRNEYASQMTELWRRGYTGEGLWGQGRSLGDVERGLGGGLVGSEELKELELCGGTFRGRGRGRKRKRKGTSTGEEKEELSWKEKRDRRIEKKFGKNGESLGADESRRLYLEIAGHGKVGGPGKPRVAQSKRGRELRAAAALARFEGQKVRQTKEEIKEEVKQEDESGEETETASDDDGEDVRDASGKRLLDSRGRGMVKVCENEDRDDIHVKQEMDELAALQIGDLPAAMEEGGEDRDSNPAPLAEAQSMALGPATKISSYILSQVAKPVPDSTTTTKFSESQICSICTTPNEPMRTTCEVCAHVLDKRKDPRAWSCEICAAQGSTYLNAGDCGICGVCGRRKAG